MAGCCEYGDEFHRFIKCYEFFCLVEEILASEEGLYSMELVGWFVLWLAS